MSVKTIFGVKIYPHPSKRKNGLRQERIEIPGFGQDAANGVDKFYKETEPGVKITKTLQGFEIDGKFVEVDMTSPLDSKTAKK